MFFFQHIMHHQQQQHQAALMAAAAASHHGAAFINPMTALATSQVPHVITSIALTSAGRFPPFCDELLFCSNNRLID